MMSLENVQRFYETIVTDEELRTRILSAHRMYEGRELLPLELERMMAQEFFPILHEEGFDFTIDELVEYQTGLKPAAKLTIDNLKEISGGANRISAVMNFVDFVRSL